MSGLAIQVRDVGFRDFGGAEGAGAGCRCWVEGEEKEFPLGLVRPLVVAVLLSVMKEFSKDVGK